MSRDHVEHERALIARVQAGDQDALRELFAIIYGELRAAAQHRLGDRASSWTLQATALANEAFIRMQAAPIVGLASRQHLLNIAAEVVDRVIVDHIRAKSALKRGGGKMRVPLDALSVPAVQTFGFDRFEALSRALAELQTTLPEYAEVARLRLILGLSVDETAETTGRTANSIKHMSRFVAAWLRQRVDEPSA